MNDIWSGAFIRTAAITAALIAIVVWAVIRRLREKKDGVERFDERQRIAQGRAFRDAFIVTAALSVAESVASANGLTGRLETPALIMLPVYAGLAALAVRLIAADALFSGDVPAWALAVGGAALISSAISTVSDLRSMTDLPYYMQSRAAITVWIAAFAVEAAIYALLVFKFVRGRRERERSEKDWREGE